MSTDPHSVILEEGEGAVPGSLVLDDPTAEEARAEISRHVLVDDVGLTVDGQDFLVLPYAFDHRAVSEFAIAGNMVWDYRAERDLDVYHFLGNRYFRVEGNAYIMFMLSILHDVRERYGALA